MSEQAHLIGSEIIRQIKSVTPPAKDLEALAISVFDSFALELPERQRLLGDPQEDGVGLFGGRGQSPDLRHNAFGLFCGVLDNHLRERYQLYDREIGRGQGILAGQTELKPDKFRHIFTGYEVKRQGETLYSYRQLIGTEETEVSPLERNAGFLRRFLYFTLLAQAADSERATRIGLLQNGAYSLAYLWVLDAVANPRATLWAVQQAEEHSDQFSMLIGEVGRRLRSLLGKFLYQSGAGWQQPESDRQEPLYVPVMRGEVFEILAFSLAKCIYDGNALTSFCWETSQIKPRLL